MHYTNFLFDFIIKYLSLVAWSFENNSKQSNLIFKIIGLECLNGEQHVIEISKYQKNHTLEKMTSDNTTYHVHLL